MNICAIEKIKLLMKSPVYALEHYEKFFTNKRIYFFL